MARFIGKKDNGFENGWQMVPMYGQKEIELSAGAGLTVIDGGAHLKTVELKETTKGGLRASTRKFTIKGLKKGKTAIWAKDRSKTSAQLTVQVIPQRIVTIAFNYVSDNAGNKTKRSPETVNSLLKKLNNIYLPQANIKFQKIAAQELKINASLGKVVIRDLKKPSKDEFSILIANRVPKAQINVFFVWECQKAGKAHDTDGVAEIAVSRNEKTNCMVEDKLGATFGRVVAHEVGHNLGLKDDYSKPDLLMYGQSDKSLGIRLRRSEIERIWAR
jgi:hypothetical protein